MPITLKVNQVSLVEHDKPHRRIESLHGSAGWGEWRHTQDRAIEYIENLLFSYYLLKDGRSVMLRVGRTGEGERFLKAENEGDIPVLLLQLPSALPAKNLTVQT